MINMDETDFSMLISGLTAFVVVMISVIYYLSKKENEEHNSQSSKISHSGVAVFKISVTMIIISVWGMEKALNQERMINGKQSIIKFYDVLKVKDASYDHSWSITTLKGHTSNVTGIDFAPDGRKFVSVSIDRTVFLWNTRDFSEREHKSVRQVLDYDTATKVVFAPDSKSLVFSVKRDNKLSVYKLVKKEGGGSYKFVRVENVDFPSPHTLDISAIGISSTGKYLMSASPDMKIVLYDIRGEILKVLQPKLFLGRSDKSCYPRVTIREYSQLPSIRIAVVRLLFLGTVGGVYSILIFVMLKDRKLLSYAISEVHFDRIHDISYSSCGKMIATAGDRHIRVFHNVPEYHSQIIRLSKALPEVTGEAPRRRIQEQIEEAREMLRKFI
uniref:WD_REPEATS_REGION domain-containing protein n=1 Tax=Heterorhabditis bacteriophora TaxID=37862 RepID=A0A1I7WBT8_HETBA